jgi:REP element-mobilizing transposase RayT
VQGELPLPRRGGTRRGAGRKPRGARAGVAHRPRPPIRRKTPVHVTVRLVPDVGNVRRFKLAPAMRRAIAGGAVKDGFRLCQFSIQRNHLHLACEADSNEALARGMQGFEIRFAKRVNGKLGRKGKVFADRFHAVPVRSPRQLRTTLCYILNNARRHGERIDDRYGGVDPFSSAWWFDGWSHDRWRRGLDPPPGGPCVAPAESWLMTEGWRRHGPIGPTELPKAARTLFPTREQWLGLTEYSGGSAGRADRGGGTGAAVLPRATAR